MLGFPTAAGGRRRLGITAMKTPKRSCGGGSDPGPLSSPSGPEVASARCCLLYHILARRAFNSRSRSKESGDANARGLALFPGFLRLV